MSASIFSSSGAAAAAPSSSHAHRAAAGASSSSFSLTTPYASLTNDFQAPPVRAASYHPRPSEKELGKLCMQLEIAGIMVGESRDAQIALLQANGYSFPRAQDAFWVMQEEEESANASDEFDLTEEKKSGDAADVKLEASSESQPAAAPVTPAQVALTFRNDSGLETPYSLKSHKPMEKYFADFIKRSGRPLTFTYKGQELKGDESPKEWKMMDGDVVLGSAPKKKRSYQHAGGMAAATAAAAASAVSNEAASPASSSDASPADGPLFKRAKSDPSIPAAAAPAAAANIIIAAPPVYRAPWKTLLLGYVPFTLRQPLGVIDPIKGTLSRAPSSHSTLASFLADLKLNQWTPDLPDPPQPDGMADSPEEQERLLAKYRAERDGNFAKNMRVVEVLKSWSNKHHAVDCFIRCISSETECPQCKRAGCACSQRRVRHSFHASISLLAGAHSEHIPSANWLFSLLHDGFREIVDLKLNQGERKLGALSLGAALELSVRTKFTRPSERSRYGGGGGGAGEEIEDAKDDFLMDGEYPSAMDDDAAPAPMPAAKKGRSRGRKAAASSESGEEDVDMVNGGAASSSGAAASSVPLSENARVRSDLGMPLDWEDDLTGPATDRLLAMTPERLSQECQLKLVLRDYQQQTVLWSLKQEALPSMSHTYWHPLEISGQKAWYSPYFQSVRFEPPEGAVGGLISEEMGLGKTIEILALINLNPYGHALPPAIPPRDDDPFAAAAASSSGFSMAAPVIPPVAARLANGRVQSRATLIIVPTSLIGQWRNELEKHSSRPLRVLIWYAITRTRNLDQLADYDVVLTSYKVVDSDANPRKGEGGGVLKQVEWHRIVVDESHNLKTSKTTQQARSILALHAKHRWLLTGTPLTSSIDDLFGQLAFFKMPFLSTDNHIPSAIRKHVFRQGYGRVNSTVDELMYPYGVCWSLLEHLFTHTIMRHKKNQPFNERPQLITLPAKTMDTIKVPFTQEERAQYDQLRQLAQEQFTEFQRNGLVVAKTIQVMQLLEPMRRACSAGVIKIDEMRERVRAIQAANAANAQEEKKRAVAAAAKADENAQPFNDPTGECSVCLDTIDDPLMTPCLHAYCAECPLFSSFVHMADGSQRRVETLQKGELLMGEDGAVVCVTENALVDGNGAPLTTKEAYRVTVQGCPPFDVTADHLMTVSWRRSYERARPHPAEAGHVFPYVMAGFSDRASLTEQRFTQRYLPPGENAPETTERFVWPTQEEAYEAAVAFCDTVPGHVKPGGPFPGGTPTANLFDSVQWYEQETVSQDFVPPNWLSSAAGRPKKCRLKKKDGAVCDMLITGPGRWTKHCELPHAELCQKLDAPKEVEKGKQSMTYFTFQKDAHAGALLPVVDLGTPGQPKDLEACLQVITTRMQKKCTVADGDLLEISVKDLAKRKGELWAREVRNHAGVFQQFHHRIMARMSPVVPPLDASAIPSVWTTETTLSAFASAAAATVDLGEGDVCYQFNQRVAYSAASAAYQYKPLAAGDPMAIFVVLHQPLVKESRRDAKGEVAFTIKQLEKAWDVLGLYGRGCVISETMPLCAKTGEVQADDPKFAKVTEQVMRTQIASGVRTFVVCGGPAKRLWSKAHEIMPDLHLQLVGLQHHEVDGKANAPYLLFRVPKSSGASFDSVPLFPPSGAEELRVYLSPHPSYWKEWTAVTLALAGAHEHAAGERVPLPDDIAEQGHVVLPIVDIVQLPVKSGGYRYARLNVMAIDQTGTEADHRYVLGNGVLTHNCISKVVRMKQDCPICRQPIASQKDLRPPPKSKVPSAIEEKEAGPLDADIVESANAMEAEPGSFVFRSKVDALLQQLRRERLLNTQTKSLIFSQFSKTIPILVQRLLADGFGVVTLEGKQTAMQRKSALDRFNTDPECTIFILSIRSGGVGLTLTAAQHIWMFEPHPNPALTQQAIHRCHRVGQTKEVFIHHLLMQDSVEEKIFAQTKAKLEVALQEEESGASAPASARAANNYRMRADELAALFA